MRKIFCFSGMFLLAVILLNDMAFKFQFSGVTDDCIHQMLVSGQDFV